MVGAGDFCVRDPGVAVLAIVLFGGYPALGHGVLSPQGEGRLTRARDGDKGGGVMAPGRVVDFVPFRRRSAGEP